MNRSSARFGWIVLALLVAGFPAAVRAQEAARAPEAKPAEAAEKPAEKKEPPKEESSVTEHSIKIGGQTINYTATFGSILLKDDKDEPTALVYYIAYTRSDTKDVSQRPLTFAYNGGPGSASAWLHMGALGPRRVVTEDAKFTPPGPYHLTDNAYSLIDKTDVVFLDPVGTGYSRAVGKANNKDFWGIDQDVHSLAQVIRLYVSRNGRWQSPKYLLGESYGTFRSAALGNYLQQHDGMALNGIVLISNVLDLSSLRFGAGDDRCYILYLPSYAATAWYHKMLKNPPSDLHAFLEDARKFAAGEYASALMKGARLTDAEKADMAKKLSAYSGLSEDYLIKANLRVNLGQFRDELKRAQGETTGRLDARFTGYTYDLLSEFAVTDPQSNAITGAYTAAINYYLREELKYKTDRNYNLLGGEPGRNWDWRRAEGPGRFFPGAPNVMEDLAQAMIANPHLHVEVENGIYDLATPFFATEYTMEHLGLPAKLQSHIVEKYYEAGHMMYVHEDSLAKLKENVGKFIDETSHH
jgi:carboxypeptidase C (cathepsin A)